MIFCPCYACESASPGSRCGTCRSAKSEWTASASASNHPSTDDYKDTTETNYDGLSRYWLMDVNPNHSDNTVQSSRHVDAQAECLSLDVLSGNEGTRGSIVYHDGNRQVTVDYY